MFLFVRIVVLFKTVLCIVALPSHYLIAKVKKRPTVWDHFYRGEFTTRVYSNAAGRRAGHRTVSWVCFRLFV